MPKIRPSVQVIKQHYNIRIAEDLANNLMNSPSSFDIVSSDKTTDTITVKFYNAGIKEE